MSTPMDGPVTVAPVRSSFRGFMVALLMVLLLCGLPVGGLWWLLRPGDGEMTLHERPYAGQKHGTDKVAIIHIGGVLMEGMLGFAQKQIDHASEDPLVKAVVLRINSPGGTITASDDLHHRLQKLRDGDTLRKTPGKPIIVSMGSIAASGGYYIAMPGQTIFAERGSITGSIGVYAALPNVKELGDKVGVKMIVIKRGGVKYSGSPWSDLTTVERALWQDFIDDAYERFKAVVEEGRPKLKGKMEEDAIRKTVTVTIPKKDGEKTEKVPLVRQRADGGTFTAPEALELGLIDKVGYLEDAIQEARRVAGLGERSKVIQYDRPPSLLGILGLDIKQGGGNVDAGQAANLLVPRLWYLSSQTDLAGLAQTLTPFSGEP